MRFQRLGIFALALAIPAFSSSYTSVVVYGDSLSDNGNLFAAIGQPPAPWFDGRFSNGIVAVEYLATILNAPLVDFAVGGATTGIGNHLDNGTPTSLDVLPGMSTSYAATQASLGPALGGLFVVWGGSNDFLSPDPADSFPFGVADRAVDNLISIASGLKSQGARTILVPGLPDLGLTPFYLAAGPVASAGATAVSDYFNNRLVSHLPDGVVYFDTATLLRTVTANPSAYGFTNVTDSCLTQAACAADPSKFLFWDDFHPTTAGHAILGQAFAQAVPEPSTIVLLPAILAIGFFARRRLGVTERSSLS